jgi:hypothetical protein
MESANAADWVEAEAGGPEVANMKSLNKRQQLHLKRKLKTGMSSSSRKDNTSSSQPNCIHGKAFYEVCFLTPKCLILTFYSIWIFQNFL